MSGTSEGDEYYFIVLRFKIMQHLLMVIVLVLGIKCLTHTSQELKYLYAELWNFS